MNKTIDNDSTEMIAHIEQIRNHYTLVAGVDEVGRGPLIGDVVTAAVILDPNNPIKGLNDSKKLSEKKRNSLFDEIKEKALCFSIARATAAEIDEINILQATLLAMQRAINTLPIAANFVLVDGNKCPSLDIPSLAVIKGDSLIPEISAASILAKVTRDREMIELDGLHPEYGFAKHKGYPTALHLQAIKDHGILVTHRKSFAPIAKISKLINMNL